MCCRNLVLILELLIPECSSDQASEIKALKLQLAEAEALKEDMKLLLEAISIEKMLTQKSSSKGSQSTGKGSSDRPKKSSKAFQKQKRDPKDLSSNKTVSDVMSAILSLGEI